LQALGLGRFMGVMERRQDGGFVALALHRAAGDGRDFDARDAAVMAELAPHLVQADQLRGRVAAGTQAGADALTPQPWQVLNSLPLGLLVCRADGQVLAINRSAEHALRTSPWLSLQDGRLAAQGAPQQAQLLGCLRHVAAHAEAGVLALGSGAHRLHLAAQRTPGSLHEPHLTVFISQAGVGATVPTAVLAQLFGLTGAEASLLSAIVDGLLPTEYAQRRGVSVGTVRGQLKQVLAKTGASRQADLVRLVLSSAVAQLTGVH
jgi:DNA-binding CsgD family transcriptional regulator